MGRHKRNVGVLKDLFSGHHQVKHTVIVQEFRPVKAGGFVVHPEDTASDGLDLGTDKDELGICIEPEPGKTT